MFYNYFKIAIRNFFKHRLFLYINLTGLTVGLAVCLLIVLFVRDELSYDRFHEKADRIMLFQQFEGSSASGSAFARLLQSEIGQVQQTARLVKAKSLIGSQDKSYYESNFYFADSTVFEIFTFPLVEGNPQTALNAPHNLVISEEMAQKYFPNEDPVGKILEYGNQQDLTITGIMKNLPENSHLNIEFLCAYESKSQLLGFDWSGYWNSNVLTYLLIAPGTKPGEINAQMPKIVEKANDPNSGVWLLSAIPMSDIYLKHTLDDRVKAHRAVENIWIFSIIAIFILSLACFNYVNLVTANSSVRAQEVGVRKLLGARKKQLLIQFISESGVVLSISVMLALLVVQLVLPQFNQFIGKDLSLTSLLQPKLITVFFAGFGLICLITGIYPALVLTSFQPVTVLKNTIFGNKNDSWFRKVLVLFQFTVSVILILATLVVMNQLSFIQQKDLGYQREQVLNITFQGDVTEAQKQRLKQEVLSLSSVVSASSVNMLPGQGAYQNKLIEEVVPEGKEISYSYLTTDENFLKTFDIALKEGRFFDEASSSQKNQFIVNESMLNHLEWSDGAIGKRIGYYIYQSNAQGGYDQIPVTGEVIGVVGDYHQSDLKTPIYPMVFKYMNMHEYAESLNNEMAIRIESGQIGEVVKSINEIWTSIFPEKPFEYKFLDEAFDQSYAKEAKTGQIISIFTGLAIFISCLGLLGLVAFSAQRRIKEIGIRKVLGATTTSVVGLLSRDFMKLIAVALVVGLPLAIYLMEKWLQNFAYRIEITWGLLLITSLAVIGVALLTISFQSVKAALANPVDTIRMGD